MADDDGGFVRSRREILGITQRELAERSGVKQPSIAAIERGRRDASGAARSALEAALALRPSVALAARRGAVRQLFAAARLGEPKVVGSVARGEDRIDSDLDLLVEELPQSFEDARADVEWAQIGRMRSLIAHHDDNVNDRLVFSALAERVPRLAAALELDPR